MFEEHTTPESADETIDSHDSSVTNGRGDGSVNPQLDVPDTVLRDEQFVVRVDDLQPGQRATVTVETDDEEPWSSTATFEADSAGTVDLSKSAPIDGDYEVVDPMGPVWSLSPEGSDANHRYEVDPLEVYDLTVTVETDSATTSETVTVRHGAPGVESHEPGENGPAGVWFEPAGAGPHPPVLVLHGSSGHPLVGVAALLASHGYAAFALRYLGVGDMPDHPSEVPLEYIEEAIDWFLDREAVADGGYGVYGGSIGAQLGLILASNDDRVDAVVSDAGNPYHFSSGDTAVWTRDGEPLPYIGIRDQPADTWYYRVDGGIARRETFVQMLEAASTERRKAATIPVENADATVLLLSGSDDLQWPSTQFANALIARLDAVEYDPHYEHRVYHDAGHVIGVPHVPTTWRPTAGNGFAWGGDPAAHASAQADAWPRILELFRAVGSEGRQ